MAGGDDNTETETAFHKWCPVTLLPLNLYELEQIILYFSLSGSFAKLFPNHLLHLEVTLCTRFSKYGALLDNLEFV